ncbi:hypothetical protein ACVIM5_005612 [Bradyrhizobium sp. USDA 4512]
MRATSETLAPGSSDAATSRSFSSCDHRRRRSTDVITSAREIVIALLLGLQRSRPSNKAALKGGIPSRPLRSRIELSWTVERAPERDQQQAQKFSEPGEDATEVVSDGGENDVGGIAGAALEVAPAEVSFGFEVSDDGLNGGAAAQLTLDGAENTALLAGDEDAAGDFARRGRGSPCRRRPARSHSR